MGYVSSTELLRSCLRDPGIRFLPLAEETFSVVYAPSLLDAEEASRKLGLFADLPFVSFSKACAPGVAELAARICERSGFVPKTVFVAGDYGSVLRLVSSGLGWSIVPTMAIENSRLDLASWVLSDLPERITIGVTVCDDGEEDALLESLLAVVKRYFAAR